jgi:hypothetical protein
MNNEFVRVWNEAIVAWVKVLSYHLLEGTEENHRNLK